MRLRILPLTILAILAFSSLALAAKEKDKDQEELPPGEVDLTIPIAPGDPSTYVCEADTTFTWVPMPVQEPGPDKRQDPTRKVEPKMVESEPIEVFYVRIGESGVVGTDVKKRLELRLTTAKSQALAHCRNIHEHESRCISRKITSRNTEYQQMDFASRKAFLDAVTADCKRQSGRCKSADVKEIKCFIKRPPDEPASDSGGGGKKKKKKKKKKK